MTGEGFLQNRLAEHIDCCKLPVNSTLLLFDYRQDRLHSVNEHSLFFQRTQRDDKLLECSQVDVLLCRRRCVRLDLCTK